MKHYYRMTKYLGNTMQGRIIKYYTEEEMLRYSKACGNEYELIA